MLNFLYLFIFIIPILIVAFLAIDVFKFLDSQKNRISWSNPYPKNKKTKKDYIKIILSFSKENWQIFPSLFFGIILILLLSINGISPSLEKKLITMNSQVISFSGIMSAIIIGFISSLAIQIRRENNEKLKKVTVLTQKIHFLRNIFHRIFNNHSFWPKGLKSYVDSKYKNLTYFDVRKSVFVDTIEITPLAQKFIDDREYGDTKNLYLQLKSIILDHGFDETLYSEFDAPIYYNTDFLFDWINHNCGSGLYYYFDHKWSIFKEEFNFNCLTIFDSEKIKKIVLKIDQDRYKNVEINNELFSMLGTQFTEDILPKLYNYQVSCEEGLPKVVKYLYIILVILLISGVIIPISSFLLEFNIIIIAYSITIVLSTSIYLLLSYFSLLNNEVKM